MRKRITSALFANKVYVRLSTITGCLDLCSWYHVFPYNRISNNSLFTVKTSSSSAYCK